MCSHMALFSDSVIKTICKSARCFMRNLSLKKWYKCSQTLEQLLHTTSEKRRRTNISWVWWSKITHFYIFFCRTAFSFLSVECLAVDKAGFRHLYLRDCERMMDELVAPMRFLKMDDIEFVAMKACILFNPGTFLWLSNL